MWHACLFIGYRSRAESINFIRKIRPKGFQNFHWCLTLRFPEMQFPVVVMSHIVSLVIVIGNLSGAGASYKLISFKNFRERKTRANETRNMRACWSDRLQAYQSFTQNQSQLSYCSLEVVYAVKDCDPCGAILSSQSFCDHRSVYRHSLSVTPETIICHSLPLSVCLSCY